MPRVPGDDDRVLETFIDVAGRLIAIPVQRKKRLAVLRWMVEDFQPGRLYPEAEVNRMISRRHPDFAALRRYLVDEELMQRRRGVYCRTSTLSNGGFYPPSFSDFWAGSYIAAALRRACKCGSQAGLPPRQRGPPTIHPPT